ncbi:UNKNOWN [Stylonychia lemnae]|uniref:Uncharacterized protein n=1 Tax=Stylonychia lemnae TaxID=5949 RepID=A0A078B8N7_STYLE|nr:UNKNOWN [Stylonychia lemnae]|eukprot:CDW90576.1 UNKNOWN [Stylonychia lemnae]
MPLPNNEIQFHNVEAQEKKNILQGASGVEDVRNNLKEQYKREITDQYMQRERSKSNKRDAYMQRVQSQQQIQTGLAMGGNGQGINTQRQIPPSSNSNSRFKYSYFNINNNNGGMTPQHIENKITYHDIQPGNANHDPNNILDKPQTAMSRPMTQGADKDKKAQYIGGAGAPLKDQNGQTITIRNPHMHQQFERKPKGILKKQDEKFDYYRSDNKSRGGGGDNFQNFQPPQQQFQPQNIQPQIQPQPQFNFDPPNSTPYNLPNSLADFPKADYIVNIGDPIKNEIQQIPPSTTQMPNMNAEQFNQFANQLVLYLHQERMAREAEKSQKNTSYDLELDRIRQERLKLQQDHEKKLKQREDEYAELHKANMERVNELWQKKVHDERKRFDTMRSMKIAKAQEGEESILLTESFPNILEQELRTQVQDLTSEIQKNTVLAQQKMNELQQASNLIEEERLEAERQIHDLNDQMYKMKYDDVIRHKYVYQQLLTNKEDADAKPPNYVPQLLPRRKNLDYIADIPNAQEVNIPMKFYDSDRKYYNTKTDPLYHTKPLGHDVFTTDIIKQKKELGVMDNKWYDQELNYDSKLYEFGVSHLNQGLYSNNVGYIDSNRLPDRFGGFTSGLHSMNYKSTGHLGALNSDNYNKDRDLSKKPLDSVSKFTYL